MAVLFLGQQESPRYHRDIDGNILDFAQYNPSKKFRLSLFREFGQRWYTYQPDPTSPAVHEWDDLFYKVPEDASGPMNAIPISGSFQRFDGASRLFFGPATLKAFFQSAFRDPSAKRMLIVYGHGKGYSGLRQVDLLDLQEHLQQSLPASQRQKPLDILWFNSCFMGSVEASYQLRSLSDFMISSQDAEFASAAPAFDQKDVFSKKTVRQTAKQIARRYLESYSSFWEGSQRRFVLESSATLSVIETGKLDKFVGQLGRIAKKLSPLTAQNYRQLADNSQDLLMSGREDLVDLGRVLRVLARSRSLTPSKKKLLVKSLKDWGWWSLNRRVSSPRVKLEKSRSGEAVLFGFNNWSDGEQGSPAINRLSGELRPDGYMKGPLGKSWPYKIIKRDQRIVPFAVGLTRFDFAIVDLSSGNFVTEIKSVSRLFDYSFFAKASETNPVIFNGYTESSGSFSERYSGLNVLFPGADFFDNRFLDTEFSRTTSWESLLSVD